jgi:hypothetical protein
MRRSTTGFDRGLSISLALAALLAGCRNNQDPASYVTGLRVLAIKAEPPEVTAPDEPFTVTALAIDAQAPAISVAWSECLAGPVTGQPINVACVTDGGADALRPLGEGPSIQATLGTIGSRALGRADATGGVYVPLIAALAAGGQTLTAAYLLRIGRGAVPNRNPVLSGVYRVTDPVDGGAAPADAGPGDLAALDEAVPLVVHAGDQITLRATFQPGSVEVYPVYAGDPRTTAPRSVTETLSVSWFATAGTFASAASGADVPDTVFHLDQVRNGPTVHVPPSGSTIDLWVVGRDERGGADYLHRTLLLE